MIHTSVRLCRCDSHFSQPSCSYFLVWQGFTSRSKALRQEGQRKGCTTDIVVLHHSCKPPYFFTLLSAFLPPSPSIDLRALDAFTAYIYASSRRSFEAGGAYIATRASPFEPIRSDNSILCNLILHLAKQDPVRIPLDAPNLHIVLFPIRAPSVNPPAPPEAPVHRLDLQRAILDPCSRVP
jgi:hypothetical protein